MSWDLLKPLSAREYVYMGPGELHSPGPLAEPELETPGQGEKALEGLGP